MRRSLGDKMAFRATRSSAGAGGRGARLRISGADGPHALSAIAQQVQHGEGAKLPVERNRVGPPVGLQLPTLPGVVSHEPALVGAMWGPQRPTTEPRAALGRPATEADTASHMRADVTPTRWAST